MPKRKFEIQFEIDGEEIDTGIIELDQKVIDVVNDEWRSFFYNLYTPEEIAAHIGYNLVINNAKLSDLDGWADLSDNLARVIDWPQLDNWETSAREI
jgi:hypothetical protein